MAAAKSLATRCAMPLVVPAMSAAVAQSSAVVASLANIDAATHSAKGDCLP